MEPSLNKESLKTLRILYPIFKEEVYRRRAEIARVSRRGSLLFTSFSIVLLFLPSKLIFSPHLKSLLVLGISIAAAFLIAQIIQEKSRHEKAKRQLITLEKGLQFFESGSYLPDQTLYPVEWQERPKRDKGMWVSLAGLIGTAIVLIWIILFL